MTSDMVLKEANVTYFARLTEYLVNYHLNPSQSNM